MSPLRINLGPAGREKEDTISPQNSLGRTLQERLSEFYGSHCGIKEPEEKEKNKSLLSTYVLTKLSVTLKTGSHPIL